MIVYKTKKVMPVSIKQSDDYELRLLRSVDAALETDRWRIARELHDQMGQDLVALTLGLEAMKRSYSANPDAVFNISQMLGIVAQIDQQVHDIALELAPTLLQNLGLKMALLNLVERWSVNTEVKVHFQCEDIDSVHLVQPVEIAIYRIVQEILTNVSKHAHAHNVDLSLRHKNGRIYLAITDDGIGVDQKAIKSNSRQNCGLGLLGIRERVRLLNGDLEIKSKLYKGFIVKVSLPLSTQ